MKMKWQQFQKNDAEEIDEHNQPTEPMPRFVLSPSSPTIPNEEPLLEDPTIPMPVPSEQPFPQQQVSNVPPSPPAYNPAPAPYPYLPPAPAISVGDRLAGGTVPGQPGKTRGSVKTTQIRRSRIPLLVGLLFVAVQLVLLMRVVLNLINLTAGSGWVDSIYIVSGIFVMPFRQLFMNVNLPIPISMQVYTLLAILVYGLLSRILVRFLKMLLNSR
jgi:hypothetical protein